MAFLLGCEKVHLEYPTKVIFESLSLGVNDGDCIGIVGRNGDGKSSLLGLFNGSIEPDSGRVTHTRTVRLQTLGQTDSLDNDKTIIENVVGDVPEYVWASDPAIRKILSGLIGDLDLERTVAGLSGGERRRVDLCRVLIAPADVLLLDEPTNHLDMGAIAWLAGHLKQRFRRKEGALVVVTHDRWFLDEVCQNMWEVHDGIVEPFEGGYSAYVQQRVERDRQIAQAEAKRRNLMRRELAWLSRGARARSTKPKFHVDAARELIAQEPPIRNTVELKRAAVSRLGKKCVDVVDVTFGYGDGRKILDDVTWLIGPGDRYGLLGENGVGKSTLLDLVQGKLAPTKGRVKIGKTVKFAFLSQKLEELEEQNSSLVREVLNRYQSHYEVDGKIVSPAMLLEQLGFEKAYLNTRVQDLSGGQKRRLQLMLILLDAPNVLILDEPSNDMDTDMMVAMENVLDSWPGTLIVVTHDRFLMERVTDDQFALIDGKLTHCPRGIDDYLYLLEERDKVRDAESERQARQELGAAEAPATKGPSMSNAELQKAKKRLRSLETKMSTATKRRDEAKAGMFAIDPSDYLALGEAQQKLDELQDQLDELEMEWLEVSELLGE
ncbi:MAG: ABC-F family ATP-binding cassette domain-containing protein [Coriobacteriia bacterium]|nr:ABC-F family ATP-binding cassette domain-containing protein [Coriobacteriia bacterium]